MRKNHRLHLVFWLTAGVAASAAGSPQLIVPERPVAPPIISLAPGAQEYPRIATNGEDFLAVWSDHRGNGDVYGARLDERGQLLDPTGLLIAKGSALTAVASDGDGYLVVLAHSCSLDVVRVSAEGVVSAARQVADTAPFCVSDVEIASNGQTFLVVFPPGRALHLDRDGTLLRTIPFVASKSIDVASDGRDFLIAGLRPVGSRFDVVSMPVTGQGVTGAVTLVDPAVEASGITVASDGGRYLVVTSGASLRAHLLERNGTVFSGPQIVVTPRPTLAVRAVWSGNQYLVPFAQESSPISDLVSMARIRPDGTVTGVTAVTPSSRGPIANFDIAPSSNSDGFLTWNTNGDIFGARWGNANATGTSLQVIIVAASASAETSPRLVKTSSGFVAVWRDSSPARGFILRARAIDESLEPLSEVIDITRLELESVYAVSAEGSRVAIVWAAEGDVHLRRYTDTLVPIDIQALPVAPREPREIAVSAGSTNALVMWVTGAAQSSVQGALVNLDGPFVSTPVTILESGTGAHALSADWNGSSYLAVWARSSSAVCPACPDLSSDVVAMGLNSVGGKLESVPRLIAREGGPVVSTATAAGAPGFFILWETGSAIQGRLAPAEGEAAGPVSLISPAGVVASSPSIEAFGEGFVAGWAAHEGSRIAPQFRMVTPGSEPGLVVTFPSVETIPEAHPVSVSARGGTVVTVYQRLAPEPAYGGVTRIFARAAITPTRRRIAGR